MLYLVLFFKKRSEKFSKTMAKHLLKFQYKLYSYLIFQKYLKIYDQTLVKF